MVTLKRSLKNLELDISVAKIFCSKQQIPWQTANSAARRENTHAANTAGPAYGHSNTVAQCLVCILALCIIPTMSRRKTYLSAVQQQQQRSWSPHQAAKPVGRHWSRFLALSQTPAYTARSWVLGGRKGLVHHVVCLFYFPAFTGTHCT